MKLDMTIIYGSSDPLRSREISLKVKAGKLRKLAPKLHTNDRRPDAAELVRRDRLEIAAHFYAGVVISHRSAVEVSLHAASCTFLCIK